MAVEYRHYRDDDKNHLLDVFEKVYDKSTRAHHEILWDWVHSRDYLAQDDNIKSIVAVNDEGQAVGLNHTLPTLFYVNHVPYWGTFNMDLFIDPKYSGAGSRLIRNNLFSPALHFASPNHLSYAISKKLARGAKIEVFPVEKYILLLNPVPFLKRKSFLKWLPNFLGKPFTWYKKNTLKKYHHHDYQHHHNNHFPEDTENFTSAFLSKFKCHSSRSLEFLNWRFLDCPVSYKKLTVRKNGELVGLAVYRITKFNHRISVIISELCAYQVEGYQALLSEIIREGIQKNAADIQMFKSGCAVLDQAMTSLKAVTKRENNWIMSTVGLTPELNEFVHNEKNWYLSSADGEIEWVYFKQKPEEMLYEA